jgi:hypothetical protein
VAGQLNQESFVDTTLLVVLATEVKRGKDQHNDRKA